MKYACLNWIYDKLKKNNKLFVWKPGHHVRDDMESPQRF